MRSLIDAFKEKVVFLEQRTPAKVNIIMQDESPWNVFREDPKILRADIANVIEHAFDCGGFVAGGCARWLRSIDNKTTALNRGAYVHEGGDIDLFFRTDDGWKEFVGKYLSDNELDDEGSPKVHLSEGRLAANLMFKRGKHKRPSSYSEPPTVQAICCVTGSPEEILRGFDFHNSMVAFDREHSWVVEGWSKLEQEKILKVAWWGSRSIAFRVGKYMTKYGYHRIVNASGAMFEQLVSGTNGMTDEQKRVSRNKWISNLFPNVCDLETKLLILASTAQGIETDDLFSLTNNNVEHVYVGSYENALNHLMQRQIAANKSDFIPSRYSDPRGFNAEEYCWHV